MLNRLFIKLKPSLLNLISKIEQLEQKLQLQQKIKVTTKHKFVLSDKVLSLIVILVITFGAVIKIISTSQVVSSEILFRLVALAVIIYVISVLILKHLINEIIKSTALNLEQFRKSFVITLTILLAEIVFVLFLKINNLSFYLLPVIGFVVLVGLLLNIWWAIVFTIISGLLSVYLYAEVGTEMFYLMLYYFFSSMYVLTFTEKIFSRQDLVRTVTKSVIISYLIVISLFLVEHGAVKSLLNFQIPLKFYSKQTVVSLSSLGIIFVSNGIISLLMITLLLAPLETIYQCTTNIKLVELANFNHPLLKRLMTEAPGTYHHSLLVSSLAESVAEKLGLNPLLCKVAGYYHDIGKVVQPEYFIENQVSIQNPHAEINPSLSALIIINHVKEGVKLAREYKVGELITDIIEQHHGNSVIYGLYEKTMDLFEKDIIRYPGPKPQTKEAAVIMICDSCEAACRAIQEPTPQKIKETVERVINTKFLDGQFDEVPLTLRDIYVISNIIIQRLISFYHLRSHQNGEK